MSKADTQIIYDDDNIRVMWHPGSSDFALVTFSDLTTLADGDTFFADRPVYKADIACVGVMAKIGNWFPQASMQAAGAVILSFLTKYSSRIMWGGSMGGYGSIKFSRLLGATEVISLCPQWSLDPVECENNSTGWPQFFNSSMDSMGIKSEDISGHVFVLTDLFDKVDRFHAEMIRKFCFDAIIINVPLVGHRVTSVFAGTENMLAIINSCRVGDVFNLVRIARQARRFYDSRIDALIKRSLNRHPHLVASFLAKSPSINPEIRPLYASFLFQVVYWFLEQGDKIGAINYIVMFRNELSDPQSQIMAAIWLANLSGNTAKIRTYHNTELVYRLGQRSVGQSKHNTGNLLPSEVSVKLSLIGQSASLYVDERGIKVSLCINDIGILAENFDGNLENNEIRWKISCNSKGTFSLSHNGLYLTAQPDGLVICNRKLSGKWESFRLE